MTSTCGNIDSLRLRTPRSTLGMTTSCHNRPLALFAIALSQPTITKSRCDKIDAEFLVTTVAMH
eukprot:scaffold646496_cov19-Prasinocladus_malaysianus.AAC.1